MKRFKGEKNYNNSAVVPADVFVEGVMSRVAGRPRPLARIHSRWLRSNIMVFSTWLPSRSPAFVWRGQSLRDEFWSGVGLRSSRREMAVYLRGFLSLIDGLFLGEAPACIENVCPTEAFPEWPHVHCFSS